MKTPAITVWNSRDILSNPFITMAVKAKFFQVLFSGGSVGNKNQIYLTLCRSKGAQGSRDK